MIKEMNNLKLLFYFCFFLLAMNISAQSTTYSAAGFNGNWSNSSLWSNGFPSSTKDVIVGQSLLTSSKVNVDSECRDLTNTILAQILLINSGITLTVFGDLTLSRFSTFRNDGTLIIHGDVFDNLGTLNLLTIQVIVTSVI